MRYLLTKEFARKIEQFEIDALISRLEKVKAREGNPMAVDIRRFGNTTAFSVKNIPGPAFNVVKGLSDLDIEHIDEILAFYQSKNIPARLDITPAHASSKLLKALSERGFYQSDFHTALYGQLDTPFSLDESSVNIRLMKEYEFDLFAEIYTKGFQMPSFLVEAIAENNRVLYNNEQWRFYIAYIEEEPAGIGVLFVKDNVATIAASATIPSMRNKGVHSELIRRRLNDAYKNGCNLIIGQAKYGSVSQNNMERAGMNVAYTKSIWTK